jgi:hypothetical protein
LPNVHLAMASSSIPYSSPSTLHSLFSSSSSVFSSNTHSAPVI